MLMSLWFNKVYKYESFSISDKVQQVDERLVNIKPPNFIGRLPRSITDLAHYKAAEFKTFMLYYSLPCLWGLLPDELFYHYMLLVQLAHTLLSNRISQEQLDQCRKMAMHFCINVSVFYGQRYMTSNVHLLLHLSDRVQDLGPLWANSCFYFEDFNGQLRNLFHGTQNIDRQIAFAVCVHQSLPKLSNSLIYGTSEYELFSKLMCKRLPTKKEEIDLDLHVIGAFNADTLSETEKQTVFNTCINFKTVAVFKRAWVKGQIVHSQGYKAVTKRNSCVIRYGLKYGIIQKFVKIHPQCTNMPMCDSHCPCNTASYYALVNTLRVLPNQFPSDPVSGATVPHIKPVSGPSDFLEAVLVKEIDNLCVFVKCADDVYFVSNPANLIENE